MIFILKSFFKYILYVWVCVPHEYKCPQRSEEGTKYLTVGGYEPHCRLELKLDPLQQVLLTTDLAL